MTKNSGRLMGAHQQIDRLARRKLRLVLGTQNNDFPYFKEIVKFEGRNGPDGIKIKSPAYNEPWHYLDPLADDNKEFFEFLRLHSDGLTEALRAGDRVKASFEAAWLAHTVVDGLTPAHHYPYEETISQLRGGEDRHSRNTIAKKAVFKGATKRMTLKNMYKVYGPKGLYVSHHLFEFGVMLLIRPLKLKDVKPSHKELAMATEIGPEEYFLRSAREIAVLDLYENYLKKGWTPKLSSQVRHQLAPVIVRTVAVIWYDAYRKSRA